MASTTRSISPESGQSSSSETESEQSLSPEAEDALENLIKYRPRLFTSDPSACVPTISPVTVYDQHIDDTLRLKHVRPFSALPQQLADLVDHYLDAYKLNHDGSTPADPAQNLWITRSATILQNAWDTERAYRLGDTCHYLASTVLLHPEWSECSSVLIWNRSYVRRQHISLEYTNDFLLEGYSVRVHPDLPEAHQADPSSLSQETFNHDELRQRCPEMLIMEFLCPSAQGQTLLKNMGDYLTENFPWKHPGTSGSFSPSHASTSPPPDALPRPLDISAAPVVRSGLRHREISSSVKCTGKDGTSIVDGVRPPKRPRKPTPYRLDPKDFLQHAWGNAVISDMTFIVFTCGTHERIALRHRQSQTLYLSDLIEPTKLHQGLRYGKIHTGLHLAAVQDALDRIAAQKALEVPSRKRKASTHPSEVRQSKRRKPLLPDETSKVEEEQFSCENLLPLTSGLSVALFYFRDGIHCSITPNFLVRSADRLRPDHGPRRRLLKKKYLPQDYLSIFIGSHIHSGNSGILHHASLQITDSSGSIKTATDAVVKLAMSDRAKASLAGEFAAYQRLRDSGVTEGIVPCLGLFEDYEYGLHVLVLGYGGDSLSSREDFYHPDRHVDTEKHGEVIIPSPYREQFLSIVDDLHRAGIRHRDLRPMNLLISAEGKVSVIDFDQALIDESMDSQYEMENDRMERLLNGELVDHSIDW